MKYEFWLVVGSQFLYGNEVLETVDRRASEIAARLTEVLPYPVVYKITAKTNKEITDTVREANYDTSCAGIITWCHTFSPSKMWIDGIRDLAKPWCHLATQYNIEIPNDEIDMDFMNLNQAAHGDREHGFLGARLRKPRKIIAGHWTDERVHKRLSDWMRSAVGAAVSKNMKVMRFGDNMREVAVTEGDKVEAQIKLGWQVNTWAVGDLVSEMDAVTDAEIDELYKTYESEYDIATDNTEAIRYQAREEIAIRKMMDREGCMAFSNTFQDLYGMEQLPGLASQHLMAQGYGYGGEGDWNIGMNAKDPARLVFEGKAGEGIVASLIDMGGRLRLIVQDIECVKPIMPMPNLPVARVMWRAKPDLLTGVECWITAGGAHHTVLSYDVTAEMMRDWANIMDIEFVHITEDTTPEKLEDELFIKDIAWKLK